MPYSASVRIVATRVFERRARKLLSGPMRAAAELTIAVGPERWPIISGTGGCRKARVGLEGRGKRGGARVIYFFATRAGCVYLLDVYAKNEKEDLSDDDKEALRKVVRSIEAAAV